ncbi:MAG TPA: 2-phospho-L-lactate guanylyltransferase [Acidimicrobiales bacterium]|nr:2-phospho-L-lactate guanylyltransferase [Acidimicrobiales bacterium]
MRSAADLPGQLTGPVVLVPVKAFTAAKERLAPLLGPGERARLARTMAERVLGAAAPLPVAVVCDDDEVAAWARALGASVLPEPGRGLNGAVEAGVARLTAAGASEVLVVHADLPLASGLARLTGFAGVTLVPDRRDDGTNVVCLPTGTPFRFAYGAGSFARHGAEALRSGLELRVVREPELEWDVDLPSDLPVVLAPGVPR